MFHRNVLDLPDHPLAFFAALVKEPCTTCADPRRGSLTGRMAEQGPISGFEPKDLIVISSKYTPIDFTSRKNSFTKNVPAVVASDITETSEARQLILPLFTQEREVRANPFCVCFSARSSKRQPASSSVINLRQSSDVGSCRKVQRGDDIPQKLNVHC